MKISAELDRKDIINLLNAVGSYQPWKTQSSKGGFSKVGEFGTLWEWNRDYLYNTPIEDMFKLYMEIKNKYGF